MVRTQIQLSESQVRALKEIAAEYDISMAEAVRLAVDNWIRAETTLDDDERRRRALAIAGRFHSGQTDLSVNHDRYLNEAFEA